MANTRELRRRIKSVKNTAQITKAMQMVAATKMRRAQNQALAGRPYVNLLNVSLSSLLEGVSLENHKLLQSNGSSKTLVVVFSTDKGLVGALNTNVLRTVGQFTREKKDLEFVTVGKKGREFVVRTSRHVEADFENPSTVNNRLARQISKIILDKFNTGEVGEVYLIYPHFVSPLRQDPTTVKLLPIDLAHLNVILGSEATPESSKKKDAGQASMTAKDFLFEPNMSELLDFILIHSLETKIYHALLETKASEYSAQMIAMQNATDNAKDLVQDLNLTYNQTRQDAITRELLEITSASLALE